MPILRSFPIRKDQTLFAFAGILVTFSCPIQKYPGPFNPGFTPPLQGEALCARGPAHEDSRVPRQNGGLAAAVLAG